MVRRTLAGPQKKARREGRSIVWVDEAGFYLLAGVVRTYAPCGQPPVLHVPLSRDHLSVISGITDSGQLLVRTQERAFRGLDIVRFLKQILRGVGKAVVIWDGAPIHRGADIRAFVAATAGALRVEQLPGYAPDLNPDEGVWDQLKYVELRNVVCRDRKELRQQLRRAIARLRYRPDLIRSFIRHRGY